MTLDYISFRRRNVDTFEEELTANETQNANATANKLFDNLMFELSELSMVEVQFMLVKHREMRLEQK